MNQLADPSLRESYMQVGVEGLFLLQYAADKHPDLINSDISITEDMFVEAMHDGFSYIAQHSENDLMKMAVDGRLYGHIGMYDYAYWLFGKWLHEKPIGYAETACKIFSLIMVSVWGTSVGVQSMAKYFVNFYSSRDAASDGFYRARTKLALTLLPEFIPTMETMQMIETALGAKNSPIETALGAKNSPIETALPAKKFDESDHTLDDLGELGRNLGLF